MSARFRRRLSVGLVAAASVAGCSDPVGPRDVAGVFVLHRVGGSALPTELFTNEFGTSYVFADTLWFGPDGRGTRSGVWEMDYTVDLPPTGRQHGTSAFGFRAVDGRIEIAYDCPPTANCLAPPHLIARRIGDELRVVAAPHSLLRLPQTYVRVDRMR